MGLYKNKKSYIPTLFLDLFIWSLITPVLVPLIVFFYLYKSFVKLLIKSFRPDLEPITALDMPVARATLKDKPIVDIGFILKVDGDVELEQLREKFRQNFVPKNPKFVKKDDPYYRLHCTLESFCGYLCTKKVPLSLKKQITEDPFPLKEGDAQTYFSSWIHSPYKDENAPRWEMVVVKGHNRVKLSKITYVALRMHHGLIDGFGMLLLVDKLCGQESPYLVQNEPELTFFEKMRVLFPFPREVVTYWIKAINSSWPFMNLCNADKVDKFLVSWTTLDIEPLKAIRRKLNVPFSTILYVLQTGALRRHLIANGKGDQVTPDLPVFHTIPKPNHPRTRFMNHWTFVKLHTPFSNEDPIARIEETQKEYSSFIEKGLHISGSDFLGEFVNLLPTSLCLLNLQTPISMYKVSLSSMVRAPVQYTLFDHPVTNIYHTFCTKDLCPQTVLYTTTASHNKQIDITLSANPGLVGNQKMMNELAEVHFQDEMEDLIRRCKL